MKNYKLLIAFLGIFVFVSGSMAASKFSDIAGHWAEENILWANSQELVKGDEGRSAFRPNDEVTRAELVTVMQRYDDRINKMMEVLEEGKKLPPAEVLQKGYVYVLEEKKSEDGKYAYQVYTKENPWCSSGYMNEAAPIHCLLRVVDLTKQEIILELESDDKAKFKLGTETLPAPKEWYDNQSIFITDGFGDGGLAMGEGKLYNVLTKEVRLLYSYEAWSGIGSLIVANDKKIFFGQTKTGFNVYEVTDPSIEGLYDFCTEDTLDCLDPDSLEASVLAKLKKINEIAHATWATYEMGKGIIVSTQTIDGVYADYIYDAGKNEFIPHQQ